MTFKTELHAHTSEVSGCGNLPGSQVAQGYWVNGYKTLVITDHISADAYRLGKRFLSDRVDMFLSGFRQAKREGEKLGVNVLLGAEVRLVAGEEDFLVYGLEEDLIGPLMLMLDERPNIDQLHQKLTQWGMLLVQAHPFRKGHRQMPYAAIDGIEVYNGNPRHNSHNELARAYAEKGGVIMTGGSDTHEFMDVARGGIETETEITGNEALLAALRGRKYSLMETQTGFVWQV